MRVLQYIYQMEGAWDNMKGFKRNHVKAAVVLSMLITLILACSMTSQAASQKTKAMKAYKKMMTDKYILQ